MTKPEPSAPRCPYCGVAIDHKHNKCLECSVVGEPSAPLDGEPAHRCSSKVHDSATGETTFCQQLHGHAGVHDDGVLMWGVDQAVPASDTDRRLAEIRERAEGATPGPWTLQDPGPYQRKAVVDERGTELCDGPYERNRDMALMAAARSDIPYLLDLVAQLRANGGKL